jgi:hypothetical protein
MYVPDKSRSIPRISRFVNDSFRKINAPIATSPGVRTKRGRALLSSRFFIPSITQRKANVPKIDLMNNVIRAAVVIAEKVMKKKKGIAIIRFRIAKSVENANAFSLNRIFFSKIAADAENKAEVNASKYQVILVN